MNESPQSSIAVTTQHYGYGGGLLRCIQIFVDAPARTGSPSWVLNELLVVE